MPDFFCNSFETTRFFSKILGLGGLRQLPKSPKGRAGPGCSQLIVAWSWAWLKFYLGISLGYYVSLWWKKFGIFTCPLKSSTIPNWDILQISQYSRSGDWIRFSGLGGVLTRLLTCWQNGLLNANRGSTHGFPIPLNSCEAAGLNGALRLDLKDWVFFSDSGLFFLSCIGLVCCF